jgi:hypothetical protein
VETKPLFKLVGELGEFPPIQANLFGTLRFIGDALGFTPISRTLK